MGSTELGLVHGPLESWNLTDGQDIGESGPHLYPHFMDRESRRGDRTCPRSQAQGPCTSLSSQASHLIYVLGTKKSTG